MARSISRRLQDWCLGACSLGVVVAALAAIDDTCRRYLMDAAHGELPAIFPGVRVHAFAAHVADIVPIHNPSMWAFAVAAVALVVVMFRT
jgi:hypothetical protein